MGTRRRENQIIEETEVVSRSRAGRSTPILSVEWNLSPWRKLLLRYRQIDSSSFAIADQKWWQITYKNVKESIIYFSWTWRWYDRKWHRKRSDIKWYIYRDKQIPPERKGETSVGYMLFCLHSISSSIDNRTLLSENQPFFIPCCLEGLSIKVSYSPSPFQIYIEPSRYVKQEVRDTEQFYLFKIFSVFSFWIHPHSHSDILVHGWQSRCQTQLVVSWQQCCNKNLVIFEVRWRQSTQGCPHFWHQWQVQEFSKPPSVLIICLKDS